MSSLNDINNEQELKIEHNTKYGLICVHHFDEYQNNDFTVNVSTEDFVTMLKWYFYQKDKDENWEAIQWSEEEQEIADKLFTEAKKNKSVEGLIAEAHGNALFDKNGKDLYINNWRVHILEKGDSYGLDNCLIYEKDEPCVEFFDMSVNKESFPDGQFTGGRYYLSSLIETEGSDLSLMDRAVNGIGLSLDFDIPVWTVAPGDLRVIAAWLQAVSDNLAADKGLNLASKLADATERSEKTDTGVTGKDDIVKG